MIRVSVLLLPLALTPAIAAAPSPYAGQQLTGIKALDPATVDDLRAGRGMALAKAAELNSYPGPSHVLEHAAALHLSAAQRARVEASRATMADAARRIGAEIIAEEETLDRAFASGSATPEIVAGSTGRIGALQARLRAVHLLAHIETRDALHAGQVARYDELRGYTGAIQEEAPAHGAGSPHHGR